MKGICPISTKIIDENIIRLGAFFLIILLFLSFKYPLILYFIIIDFIIKLFFNSKFSPLNFISKKILYSIFKLKPVLIDFAPKYFAMVIGYMMSIFLLLFIILDYEKAFLILLFIFILALSLEMIFKFCAGCKIYSFLIFIKSKLK
ncbi:MAG: DUF4395 domain-containing protein [Candidatus Pacebacteria bacterium]|nr:DUF4395 domain-containing protein [Candidatus Paceibacterota bacterium]